MAQTPPVSLCRPLLGLAAVVLAVAPLRCSLAGEPDSEPPLTYRLGINVMSAPKYEGSSERHLGVTPDGEIHWRTANAGVYSLSPGGLMWTPRLDPVFTYGVILGYDGGRDDRDRHGGRGSAHLHGMGKIEGSTEVGVFGSVELGPVTVNSTLLAATADKGHSGVHGALEFEFGLPLAAGAGIALTPGLSWGNREYSQAYFGVTPAQSTASGLRSYAPRGGITSVGFTASTTMPLGEHWSLNGAIGIHRLVGDAANSPVVERRNQPFASVGASYSFH